MRDGRPPYSQLLTDAPNPKEKTKKKEKREEYPVFKI